MAQGSNKKMELEIRREIMESVRPVFECTTCKAFPTIESVNVYGKKCTYHGSSTCGCSRAVKVMLQPKCRNGHDTGKSLSEALLFAENGENMLCTKIVLNVRKHFCTQHVLPRFELGIFMY